MSINIAAIGSTAAVAALTPVATTLVPAVQLDALVALDAGTTTRSLLSAANVTDASASVIDFSKLAQLLAATVVFQTQEAQQAKAIASGTTTNSDSNKLVATASFFVEAFNRFQTSVGALTNSFDSSFDTGFLVALHMQNVQIGSEHVLSFIDSLAQVGINFNEATEETNPNQFKIDSQALEAAFNANPAQTTNLLDKALKGLVAIEAKLLATEPKLDLFTSDFTPALSGAVPASRFDLDMVNTNLSELSSAGIQEVNSALQRLLADESLGAAIDATPTTSSATSKLADAVGPVGNASTNVSADRSADNSVANKFDTTSSSSAASVEKLLTEIPAPMRDAILAPVVVVPDLMAARATQSVVVSNFDKSPTLPDSSIEVGLNSANLSQIAAKFSTVVNAVTQTGQGDDLGNRQDNTYFNAKVQPSTNAETNTNTKPSINGKTQTGQTRIGLSTIDSNAKVAPTRQGDTAVSAQVDRVKPVVLVSHTIATQTDLNSDNKVDAPRSNRVENNTKSGEATSAFIAESASSQLKRPAAASVVSGGSSDDEVKRVGNSIGVDKKSVTSNAARSQIQSIQQAANLVNSESTNAKEASIVQAEAQLTNKGVVTNKASIVVKPIAFPVDDVNPRTTSGSVGNFLKTSTSQAIPASAQATFEYGTVQPQATLVNPAKTVLAPAVVVPDVIAARATQPVALSDFDKSPTLPFSSIEVGLNSSDLAQSAAKISTVEKAVTQTGQGDDLGNRQDNTSFNAKVQPSTNAETNTNTKPSTSAKTQTGQTRIISSTLDSDDQVAPTRQGVNGAFTQADRARPVAAASRTIATQTDLNSDNKMDVPGRKSVESNRKSGEATSALIAESVSSQLKRPAAASVVSGGSSDDEVKRVGNSIGVDKKSLTSNAARPQIQSIRQAANLVNSESSGAKEAPTVKGDAKLMNKSVVMNKDVVTNKDSIDTKPIAFPVKDMSPRTTWASVGNVLKTSTSQAIPASLQAAFEYPTVQPQSMPVNSSINPSIAAAVAAYRLGEIVVAQKSDELASVATEIVPDVSVIPRIDVLELDPHDGNSEDERIAAALNEVKTAAQRAEFKAVYGQSPPLDSVDILA